MQLLFCNQSKVKKKLILSQSYKGAQQQHVEPNGIQFHAIITTNFKNYIVEVWTCQIQFLYLSYWNQKFKCHLLTDWLTRFRIRHSAHSGLRENGASLIAPNYSKADLIVFDNITGCCPRYGKQRLSNQTTASLLTPLNKNLFFASHLLLHLFRSYY